MSRQRTLRRKGKLDLISIRRLDDLGFDWGPSAMLWDAKYEELDRYRREHGDCNVPKRWPENEQLGSWVSTQRRAKIAGKLDSDRVRKLEDLGFEWNPSVSTWEKNFAELKHYKDIHGDCNVPQSWPDNPELGRWVRGQRGVKATGKLESERIERLDRLGFNWDPFGSAWENNFAELKHYKDIHGDCNVPVAWSINPQLSVWVRRQRQAKVRGEIEPTRLKRLEGLGFNWGLFPLAWEQKFEELARYKKEHGDCNVPKRWPGNEQLGSWVGTQRRAFVAGKLDAYRVKRLEDLGFDWDPAATTWEENFAELKRYKEKHGDCNVPRHSQENRKLANWVHTQRLTNVAGKLDRERVKRLEKIGFCWTPQKKSG